MSELTDWVAKHVWCWMNLCRERGATQIEAEIRETEDQIHATARCVFPKPAEHITLTFDLGDR